MRRLETKPEAVEVDFAHSAMVVVDIQNAFVRKGRLFDLAGLDLSGVPPVIDAIRRVVAAARNAGVPIVYLKMGFKPDLSDGGGPESPNPQKELALRLMRQRPELRGRLLIEGSWDFSVIDELAPAPGDVVVVKTRYSGFAGTTLDRQLRERGIRYLFFCGLATNVCVESTLRDAFFLEYWPILLADGCRQAGDPMLQEATLTNVESFFGWTMPAEALVRALKSLGTGT